MLSLGIVARHICVLFACFSLAAAQTDADILSRIDQLQSIQIWQTGYARDNVSASLLGNPSSPLAYDIELDLPSIADFKPEETTDLNSAIRCQPTLTSTGLTLKERDVSNNKLRATYIPKPIEELDSAHLNGFYSDVFTIQYTYTDPNTSAVITGVKAVQVDLFPINRSPITDAERDACLQYNPERTGVNQWLAMVKGGTSTYNYVIPAYHVTTGLLDGLDDDGDKIHLIEADIIGPYDSKDTTKTTITGARVLVSTTTPGQISVDFSGNPNYEGFAIVEYRVTDGASDNDGNWNRTLTAQKAIDGPYVGGAKAYCKYTFQIGNPQGPVSIYGRDSSNPVVLDEDTTSVATTLSRVFQVIPGEVRYFVVGSNITYKDAQGLVQTGTDPQFGAVTWECGGLEHAAGCPACANTIYGCFRYKPYANLYGTESFKVSYVILATDNDTVALDDSYAFSNLEEGVNMATPATIYVKINPVNDIPFGDDRLLSQVVTSTPLDDPATQPYILGYNVNKVFITMREIDNNQPTDNIYIINATNYNDVAGTFTGRFWTQVNDDGSVVPTSEITFDAVTGLVVTDGNAQLDLTRAGDNVTLVTQIYYSPGPGRRSPDGKPLDVINYAALDQKVQDDPTFKNFPSVRDYLNFQVNNFPQIVGTYGFRVQCRPGYYVDRSIPETQCTPCPPGTFSTGLDIETCTPCPIGMYQNQTGQTTCSICPLHTYMNHTGAPECDRCPFPMITRGPYKLTIKDCICPGQTTLSINDDATSILNVWPTLLGSSGFYGAPGIACVECDFGNSLFSLLEIKSLAACPFDNMTLPITRLGYYLEVIEHYETDASHFTDYRGSDVTQYLTGFYLDRPNERFQALGVGYQRTTTNQLGLLTIKSKRSQLGTYAVPYKAVVSECYPVEACPDFTDINPPLNDENFNQQIYNMTFLPCAKEYDLNRCSVCRKGPNARNCPTCKTAYKLDNNCHVCPPHAQTTFIIIIGVFAAVFAPFLFKFADIIRQTPSIMVSLNFAQVLAIFPHFNVPWPRALTKFWDNLSFFNFNIEIVHPECLSTSYSYPNKFRGIAVSPLVVLGLVIAGVLVQSVRMAFSMTVGRWLLKKFPIRGCEYYSVDCNSYRRCAKCKLTNKSPSDGLIGPPPKNLPTILYLFSKMRMILGKLITTKIGPEDLIRTARSAVSAYLTFLKIGYLFLSGAAIEYWNCNQDRISGKYYLDTDQSIQCFNLDPTTGGVWKDLFGLGVFVLIAYPVGILVVFLSLLIVGRKQLEDPVVLQMLGPLYENYQHKHFYWEIVIMARKLLILAFNVFFSQDTIRSGLRQTVASQAVLLGCLLGHVYTYPFDKRMVNILESINITATFFAAFVGMAFLSDSTGKLSAGFKVFLTGLALASGGFAALSSFLVMIFEVFPKVVLLLAANRRNKLVKERNRRRREAMRIAKKMGEQFRDVETMNRVSLAVSMRVREFVRRAVVGFSMSRLLTAGGVRATFNMTKEQDSELPPARLLMDAYKAIGEVIEKKETLSLQNEERTPIHRLMKEEAQAPIMDALLTGPRTEAMRVRKFMEETMVPLAGTPIGTLRKRGLRKKKTVDLDELIRQTADDAPSASSATPPSGTQRSLGAFFSKLFTKRKEVAPIEWTFSDISKQKEGLEGEGSEGPGPSSTGGTGSHSNSRRPSGAAGSAFQTSSAYLKGRTSPVLEPSSPVGGGGGKH